MQKKAEREARWAAAAQAQPTGRSESSEEDEATYDLTADAATYSEGLQQLDASSCNILKESSTFISDPAPPACEQQPPASQVREAPGYRVNTPKVVTLQPLIHLPDAITALLQVGWKEPIGLPAFC